MVVDWLCEEAMDRCTVVVATNDLSIGEDAVLSGSFGVLLVGSKKKIAETNFYALQDDMLHWIRQQTPVVKHSNWISILVLNLEETVSSSITEKKKALAVHLKPKIMN